MRERERAPGAALVQSPKPKVQSPEGGTAEIHHLATTPQVEVIEKLFVYLGSSPSWIEKFLEGKFKRKSSRMLTPAQANSCTMILFNIAASRDIKQHLHWQRRTGEEDEIKVTREMIRQEIPALKRRLGIDQKAEVRGQRSEDGDDEGGS
jgi:hypothetical protein